MSLWDCFQKEMGVLGQVVVEDASCWEVAKRVLAFDVEADGGKEEEPLTY